MHSATFGVIDDARGRQRRRFGMIAATAIGLAAVVGLAVSRERGPATAPVQRTVRVAPSVVLSQPPYMGTSCPTPRCDSVGLSVWLRQPATAVSATVGGHPLKLTVRAALPYQPATARARRMFVGYLAPLRLITPMHLVLVPGAMWPGNDPDPLVQLRIDSGGGRVLLTQLRVLVQPGWG
jgi:hypothetical protein